MNNVGIGHNQGPPMGGLSTLPIAEKAIGGALIKGAKAGLKSLGSMFESVGSGLKKSGLKKDERKEAAKAIQNEIDKVSEANNRKFRPKILRMETRPNQKNNYSDVVIAAVDDENGKVAAVLDGRFFTKVDRRETFKTGSGKERKNKNFGKDINYLSVGGFFPIQSGHNTRLKEILESLNVPIYDEGEGVISPENLAILNKRQSEGAMGHRPNKIEMGTKGTLGFAKSLRAGLPITDAGAGRVSGAKGEGGELNIRGASITDTAAPMGSLPDIDLSADLLEEMGDTGLRSLTPEQLETITTRIVPNIANPDLIAYQKKMQDIKQKEDPKIVEKLKGSNLPSGVKRIQAIDARMKNVIDEASARRDPYAARLLKEQDDLYSTEKVSKRKPTIGELYSDETMIEKLQYGLLNKLSGDLSGKKGLLSLVKKGDDEMIVGYRGPDDPGELMKSSDGERLVPRRDFINPRIQKEILEEEDSYMVPFDTTSQTSFRDRQSRISGAREDDRGVSPEIQDNARRFQEYRDIPRTRDDRERELEFQILRRRSNLRTSDQVIDAYNDGIITEAEGWNRITEFTNSGRISPEEALEDSVRFREAIGGGDGRLEEGSIGTYNDDGSINVELPDGTMTSTRIGPDDLGTLLSRVEDGYVSQGEARSIIEALETAMVINTDQVNEFERMLDMLPTNLVD